MKMKDKRYIEESFPPYLKLYRGEQREKLLDGFLSGRERLKDEIKDMNKQERLFK